jgi:hypothetical protein
MLKNIEMYARNKEIKRGSNHEGGGCRIRKGSILGLRVLKGVGLDGSNQGRLIEIRQPRLDQRSRQHGPLDQNQMEQGAWVHGDHRVIYNPSASHLFFFRFFLRSFSFLSFFFSFFFLRLPPTFLSSFDFFFLFK